MTKYFDIAKKHYLTIVDALKSENYSFETEEEKLLITCTFHGDDLPMNFIIRLIPYSYAVQVISPMTFNVPKEKRVEIALAITHINDHLINGGFDYNLRESALSYRSAVNYDDDSVLTKEFFLKMFYVAINTIDEYNEKLLLLAEGDMTIEEFLQLDQ